VWIEAHAEGLPLTFLNHRLVEGDSLTGPFFDHLLTFPRDRSPLEGLFADGVRQRFRAALAEALTLVKDLEADIGASLPELMKKEALKRRLDAALAPFRSVAASWAGRLMSGEGTGTEYVDIVRQALAGAAPDDPLADSGAWPFDLAFPEVFFPDVVMSRIAGASMLCWATHRGKGSTPPIKNSSRLSISASWN
jgi:hypothetical protein